MKNLNLYRLLDASPYIYTRGQAEQYAKDYQNWASEQDLSWGEIAEWENEFALIAERFDLLEEFKENNII